MKNIVILVVCLMASALLFCQDGNSFKRGYFITTQGERVDCYINAFGWPNVPRSVSYRQTHVIHQVNRDDIAEIVINGESKHIRATVMMDRSTSQMDRLGYDKEVHLEEANLLLEVLVEGSATLYRYQEFDLNRLFYRSEDKDIEQLIYKMYLKTGDNLGENLTYKQQLWDNLKCDRISLEQIGDLDYHHRTITKFFQKYNACVGGEGDAALDGGNASRVFAKIFAGPSFGGFRYRSPDVPGIQDLGSTTGFNFGLDFEYYFNGRSSAMSVFAAPYYQVLSGDYDDDFVNAEFDFGMVKLPLGIRYNAMKEGVSRFHLDLSFVFTIDGGSTLNIEDVEEDFTDSKTAVSLGAGINLNPKFSIRSQYVFPTAINDRDVNVTIYYGHLFLGLAYAISK